jgi:hypothetical protein
VWDKARGGHENRQTENQTEAETKLTEILFFCITQYFSVLTYIYKPIFFLNSGFSHQPNKTKNTKLSKPTVNLGISSSFHRGPIVLDVQKIVQCMSLVIDGFVFF